MSNKTDIWMPLYIGDFLADTAHLDAERSGCYLLWMFHYWRKGPLPAIIPDLVSIGKLRSADAPSIAQALLNEFFTLHADGKWHQKRVDIEREKWMMKKAKSEEKATLAANARWNRDSLSNAPSIPKSNVQAMLTTCPSPSPSHKEQVSDANASSPRRDADGGKADVNAPIYRAYPRKVAPRAAMKAIDNAVGRLKKGEGDRPSMDATLAREYLAGRTKSYAESPQGQQSDRSKIPHPSTWFNRSSYLDDEREWAVTFDGGARIAGGASHAGYKPASGPANIEEIASEIAAKYASRGNMSSDEIVAAAMADRLLRPEDVSEVKVRLDEYQDFRDRMKMRKSA